jgi:hypothetical protein
MTAAFELAGQPTVEHDNPLRHRAGEFHASSLLAPKDLAVPEIELPELTGVIAGWQDWTIGGTHRHVSAHAASSQRPIARSAGPSEDSSWCHLDNVAFVVSRP